MRNIFKTLLPLLFPGAIMACSVAGAGGANEALMSSVQATTGTGTVTFTFQVTNTTTEPIELEFADGQSFEFLVMRDGSEVWRWSDGQAFTQAERVMVLPAGETVRYQAVWNAPTAASGEYVVIAALTSRDGGVRQGATFRLP